MLRFTYKICSNALFTQTRYIFRNVVSPGASRRIFVVIPEIADDSNSLNIDNISSLSSYDVFVEVSRIIQNFDTNLSILTDTLNIYHRNQNYDYDSTILEIYKILEEMDSKFKFIKLISYSSDDRITKLIVFCLCNKILVASQQLLNINSLGSIINEIIKKDLNGFQQKVVEMMKINFTRFGGYLPKDKMDVMRYNINLLLRYQMKFNESVVNSKFKLQQYVDRSDLADDIPKWLLSQLKISGLGDSYMINIENNFLVHEFLKYCVNPLIRNQIWLSTRQVGGKIIYDYKFSNYKTISEIRHYRKSIANNLDCDNYASFIFKTNTRMAKSLDDVIHLLEKYKSMVLPAAEKEFEDLNEYAIKGKGLKESLMPWDNDYIQHCYSLDVLKCPWRKLESDDQQFNFNSIMERVFYLLHRIFNLTFSKKYITHNEISYTVSTQNIMGELVFKINRNSRRNLIKVMPLMVNIENKAIKVSYIIINLKVDNPNIFNCLEIIGNLGTILQYQLGSNNIEINPLYTGMPADVVNVSSQFLLHSFMSSKEILEYIFPELGSRTCQDLSESYANKGLNMINNIACLEALYVAYFDIEMGLSNKSWQNIQMDLWHDFFGSSSKSKLYFPFQKLDEWPCSATDVFSDQLWGGVKKYSLFWTDNIVRILFKKFVDAKFNDWNPNEDLNPELINLFHIFQKSFIEQKYSAQQVLL